MNMLNVRPLLTHGMIKIWKFGPDTCNNGSGIHMWHHDDDLEENMA